VKSGLVDIPRVSQYRLTSHLGLAVIIYGLMMWLVFELFFAEKCCRHPQKPIPQWLQRLSIVLVILVFIMILSGGLVSGIRAGFGYNTFPLMNGYFFPPGLYGLDPIWISIFEQNVTVQFNHRLLAYSLCMFVIILVIFAWRHGILQKQSGSYLKRGIYVLLIMLMIQVSLGISTLVFVVPVPLAAAHQGGAILLFTAALFVCFTAIRPLLKKS
jgi:heme a synthase